MSLLLEDKLFLCNARNNRINIMKKCAALGPCSAYFLSDGTPLGDAIRAQGLNKVTVYSRIRRGLSPDQAVAADPLPKGKRPFYRLKDGRPLARAIRESGVSRRCVYYAVKAGHPRMMPWEQSSTGPKELRGGVSSSAPAALASPIKTGKGSLDPAFSAGDVIVDPLSVALAWQSALLRSAGPFDGTACGFAAAGLSCLPASC